MAREQPQPTVLPNKSVESAPTKIDWDRYTVLAAKIVASTLAAMILFFPAALFYLLKWSPNALTFILDAIWSKDADNK